MKTIKKTIEICDSYLLSGVEDFFNDLIKEEGLTVTEALNAIAEDAVLRYETIRLYPSYTVVHSIDNGNGVFDLEMEKWC
jgi:hypothetical protein